jgi:putative Ca2+/H+ antiporter (TMEM165/GDT1 family)
MHIHGEIFAAFVLWLALMTVLGVWVVRITTLLYRQRRAEVAYRLHLATAMGAAVREQRSEAGEQG